MKISRLLIIGILLVSMVGCKNDDGGNSSGTQTDGLVGTWSLIAINSDTALDLNEDGTASTSLEEEEPCVLTTEVSFLADGTLMNEPSFAIFTFGNIDIVCVDSSFEGTWSLNDDQLTLNQAQTTATTTIVLDGDSLTFKNLTQGLGGASLDGVYERQ